MQLLELVGEDDPILREVVPDYVGEAQALKDLAKSMFQVMRGGKDREKGVGLAANQVGKRVRMFVINLALQEFGRSMVCINPVLLSKGHVLETRPEGRLTWPFRRIAVTRPAEVAVEYTDLLGRVQLRELNGLYARVVQHELDHLNGVTIFPLT